VVKIDGKGLVLLIHVVKISEHQFHSGRLFPTSSVIKRQLDGFEKLHYAKMNEWL
jgi:hypothetical protein